MMKTSDWKEADISWDELEQLRERFLAVTTGDAPDYWRSRALLKSYDLTFGARIGWKWEAVLKELSPWLSAQKQPLRVLDWGCGTARAARHFLSHLDPLVPRSVFLWDRSEMAREWAKEKLREEGYHGTIVCDLAPPAESQDLFVLLSHVANEISPPTLSWVISQLKSASAFLWVEPGTPQSSQFLISVREELRESFQIIAPCPHQNVCGLRALADGRHWCHQFAPVPTEVFCNANWRVFGNRLGIDLRSLPVTFLVMQKDKIILRGKESRVLGRPRRYKGYAEALVCSEQGVGPEKILKSKAPAWMAQLKKTVFDLRLPAKL